MGTETPVLEYDFSKLHPKIRKMCESLFVTQHYYEAIRNAYTLLEVLVKEKAGLDESGKTLMQDVFTPNSPIIKLNPLRNQSDKDEQEGFMHLFMGAMSGIRNPKAHEVVDQHDPSRTFEYLAFASLLARRVDEGEVVKKGETLQSKKTVPKQSDSRQRQQLNSDIVEKVLNPAYSELFQLVQSITNMREEAAETNMSAPFLNQVASNWLYTKVDPTLRMRMDGLRRLVINLSDSKETCRNLTNVITNRCASKVFEFDGVSMVYLWYHRGIPQQPVEGRGIWFNVLLGESPLEGSMSSRVSRIELQHPMDKPQYFDIRESRSLIDKFLHLAFDLAMKDDNIQGFRKMLSELTSEASHVKDMIGSEIDRLQSK